MGKSASIAALDLGAYIRHLPVAVVAHRLSADDVGDVAAGTLCCLHPLPKRERARGEGYFDRIGGVHHPVVVRAAAAAA